MPKSTLRVSIVIPVYNEQDHLAACLEAISKQTVQPLEVVVVDNNSTDDTLDVARKFPFVKILKESKQGVVYARDRGFDAALGEVIGRIDADSLLPDDWVEKVALIFDDDSIDAMSGAITYYDMSLARALDRIDAVVRRHVASALDENVFLYGANMAIRRSAWLAVKKKVCHLSGMHEDFDLAIHMQELGLSVSYDERLVAAVSTRRADTSFVDFCRYTSVSPHTYSRHNVAGRFHMYPVVALAIAGYTPLWILRKGYNPVTNRFSLYQLLQESKSARVDPTTNIV